VIEFVVSLFVLESRSRETRPLAQLSHTKLLLPRYEPPRLHSRRVSSNEPEAYQTTPRSKVLAGKWGSETETRPREPRTERPPGLRSSEELPLETQLLIPRTVCAATSRSFMTTFPAGLLHSTHDKQSRSSLSDANDVCGAIKLAPTREVEYLDVR
jgi:hypothetical protein